MSEDSSPKHYRVRVRSTFELANPIRELPPDPDAVALSPNTLRQKAKEIDDLLKNATNEDGISMDTIATYIPSKATLKRREEEAARAKAETDEAARLSNVAAQIAYHQAQIIKLTSGILDDGQLAAQELEKLSITRPTSVGLPNWTSRASSDSITMVSSPTIGALAAAPPAMGALMGASPSVGAMVAAALQPAQVKRVDSGDGDDKSLCEDFQIVHNEFKQAEAMERANKKCH